MKSLTSSTVFLSVLLDFIVVLSQIRANPVRETTGKCSVLINGGLAEPQPLILRPGIGAGFAVPDEPGSGRVVLSAGESLRLICLGSSFDIETPEPISEAFVTCINGTTFSFDELGLVESFENIGCLSYPKHTARRTGVPCPNGELCEIGFDLGNGEFERIITACHDDVNQHTIVAHAKVPAVIDASQTSFPRPGFVKGDFYAGVSMANIYTKVNQRITLGQIVGSDELALKYLPETGTYYIARGHLAAKVDFIYGSQQRATFYYLNAVPMWQNVNGGNWAIIEANLRKIASERNMDLDMWTGSLGILELADVNGVDQQFHLYVDANNNTAVPVPKILFKVVHHQTSGLGVVFITVNNPYLEELDKDHIVCKDISEQITYLTWKPTRSDRGLSYACEVDDFRQTFKDIPPFVTTGILT